MWLERSLPLPPTLRQKPLLARAGPAGAAAALGGGDSFPRARGSAGPFLALAGGSSPPRSALQLAVGTVAPRYPTPGSARCRGQRG